LESLLFVGGSQQQQQQQADLKKRQEAGGPVPSGLTPLVIVPSLLGSRLQAQLNHVQTSYVHRQTSRHHVHV
jgi:hypothetical protein